MRLLVWLQALFRRVLVADALNLLFVYVRSTPKIGLENLIEGELRPGMKVVVVEDLISTGGSSLKAVEAIRRDGCEVIGMVAAYTYGFPVAEEAFKNAKVTLVTLTNYEAVLDVALRTGYIEEEDIQTLNEWRKTLLIGMLENKIHLIKHILVKELFGQYLAGLFFFCFILIEN